MNKLKEIRESKDMTISRLSHLSGISRETIYRLEAVPEVKTANTKTLSALADALGVKISDFFMN